LLCAHESPRVAGAPNLDREVASSKGRHEPEIFVLAFTER
jgi:hypothetical protein